jgi:hypothetical protein
MASLAQRYQCQRKVRHADVMEAQKAVLDMQRKERVPFVYYPCGICGGYHTAKADYPARIPRGMPILRRFRV